MIPLDTTGHELYNTLIERIRQDDAAVKEILGTISKNDNLMLQIERLIQKTDIPRSVFALKSAAVKRMLRKNQPKKSYETVGLSNGSLESMLKHESPVQIYAAAAIAESAQWHRTKFTQYKRLKSTDFEVRDITFATPNSAQWKKIAAEYVAKNRHVQ